MHCASTVPNGNDLPHCLIGPDAYTHHAKLIIVLSEIRASVVQAVALLHFAFRC